jgi:nitrate reductase NapE
MTLMKPPHRVFLPVCGVVQTATLQRRMLALTLEPKTTPATPTLPHTRAQELLSFVFLSVVMAPVIAGVVITCYGFLVWMFQLMAGPPGS